MTSHTKSKHPRGIIFDLDNCILSSYFQDTLWLKNVLSVDSSYMAIRSRLYEITIKDINGVKGDGASMKMWGVKRPHLHEFLLFCFEYFDVVCVWSAGSYDYVHECVERLFGDIKMPDLIFTRDDCEDIPGSGGDYHKPIAKMVSHPAIKGKVSLLDTFFLDDKENNFISSPGNGIVIPEYVPEARPLDLMKDDVSLLELQQWLMKPEVMAAGDVRTLDKTDIFHSSKGKINTIYSGMNEDVHYPQTIAVSA